MSFPGALTLARALVTLVVVLLLVGVTVGLHDATASSSDAWATSVEAVATVVLVVITRVVRLSDVQADELARAGTACGELGGFTAGAEPIDGTTASDTVDGGRVLLG